MDDMDRDIINNNLDELVNNTDYNVLRSECIQRNMLSETMAYRIESTSHDGRARHKKLFEKTTKRGPRAFNTLLSICQRLFPAAYSILKPSSNDQQMHSTHNPQHVRTVGCNEATMTYSHQLPSEEVGKDCKHVLRVYPAMLPTLRKVKLSAGPMKNHPQVPAYSMKSRNRGVAFIVNVINFCNDERDELKRNGADIDGRNLISLFQQLGFVVFYYTDITLDDWKKLLVQLKESEHLSCDCFAFYILSHGERENGVDYVLLHDKSRLRVEDLFAEFNTENCPRLIRKPKLFFISTCRGIQPDLGSYRVSSYTERDGRAILQNFLPPNMITPTFCDMLLCYATVPGYASHRDIYTGSWFVESMCKIWSDHAHNTDVEMLMKLVGEYAASFITKGLAIQTICTEQRGFFKQLYLNPGYYENSGEL